jgi:F-type H+-transporting ATPase subunit a
MNDLLNLSFLTPRASDPLDHPTLFHAFIPGMDKPISTFIAMGMTIIILLICGLMLMATYKKLRDKAVVPDAGVTLRNFFELMVGGLRGLIVGTIGEKHGPKYVPLLAMLFIFIFFMNLLGNIPGMPAATSNVNINLGISLFVFLAYNFIGIREHGPGYIKQFLGPMVALAPLMLVIELISHLVRPASLAIRLTGNITGDHVAVGIFQQFTYLVIPSIFMMLGLFVAFIQALVFTLLSAVYIQLATSHDH